MYRIFIISLFQDVIILLVLIFSANDTVVLPALTRGFLWKSTHDDELRTSPVVALALMLSHGVLFRVAGRKVVCFYCSTSPQHMANGPAIVFERCVGPTKLLQGNSIPLTQVFIFEMFFFFKFDFEGNCLVFVGPYWSMLPWLLAAMFDKATHYNPRFYANR